MATKKRQARKLARVTAERLEELRMESSLTVAEFAERCKLPGKPSPAHTTFVAWRSGGSIPGGEYLRQIAVEFGVTTDWLLGIAGAAKHPNQSRSDAELAEDLASAAERELRQRVPPTVPGAAEPFEWRVMGDVALESVLDTLEADAHRALERQRARTAFLTDVESLQRAVRPITERLARGEEISEREAAIAQRLVAATQRVLERMQEQSETGDDARVVLRPEAR
jgi:transcriptional regulator with XRE-family HTH domain